MLTGLHLRNFVICEDSYIQFNSGFTAITGETGAGKSIMFDALALVTGSRANYSMIMNGKESAVITACFDLTRLTEVKRWLNENDIDVSDELIIKRSIRANKTSKCYINGEPVTVATLAQVGFYLLRIYEQHAHHELMHTKNHLSIIDSVCKTQEHHIMVRSLFAKIKALTDELTSLKVKQKSMAERKELVNYYLQELIELSPSEEDYLSISERLKLISSSTDIANHCSIASSLLCADESGLISMSSSLLSHVESLSNMDSSFSQVVSMLQEVKINLEESSSHIEHYISNIEIDPHEEATLTERISKYVSISRKHGVQPENLSETLESLQKESIDSDSIVQEIESTQKKLEIVSKDYWDANELLSAVRRDAFEELQSKLISIFPSLGLNDSIFEGKFEEVEHPTSNGSMTAEFWFSANLGVLPGPLHKVVSGGELSRIALAIQVVVASEITCPTMIFDEVDVGISGQASEVVGKLLRKLGQNGQSIAVTHQATVAASAHNNFLVEKTTKEQYTTTKVRTLSSYDKQKEIARLLSGDDSAEALSHATLLINRCAA
ncbi:DNA repair protein RecN [Vibrio harveyi]|uniref:DNA repair protein RecN n=1 Tax=Vibrio harveyi TaxID=669 RepID=UPI003CF94B40